MGTAALIEAPPTAASAGAHQQPSTTTRPRLVVLEGGRGRTGLVSSPICRPVLLPAALVRRRRLAVVAAVAAILVVIAARLDGGAAVPTQAQPRPIAAGEHSVYVVQPGDTLWSIARRLDADGDVRATVDALVERHGSASVDVGDRIPLGGLADDP
ncbi:MAG: LysM peptidoglycan-binding domain-containing protein [Acidimicrobiales bacterium]